MCDNVFWRLSLLKGLNYTFVKKQQEVRDCALVHGYGGNHVLIKT